MIRRSSVLVLVLSAFASLLLTACGGSTNPLLGEWQAANPAITLKFFQDGTVILKQDGRTFAGQYKSLDSENIRLDMQGDLGLSSSVLEGIKITGNTLTTTLNGQQITFSRTSTSSSQSTSDLQVTPASQSPSGSQGSASSAPNSDGVQVLVGKWQSESITDPLVHEFTLEASGKIKVIIINPDGRSQEIGDMELQPAGNGKFTGYLIHSENAQETRSPIEIQVSDNGQRMTGRQQSINGQWTDIAAWVRFPRPTPVAISSNLAPNPSFEEGETLPAGWVPQDKATLANVWDVTQAHSGQHSLALVGPLPESRIVAWESSEWIPVKPNHIYRVGVWFRRNLPKELTSTFNVSSEDGGGASMPLEAANGDWQYIEFLFDSQPEYNKVKLMLQLSGFGSSVAAPKDQGIWIDDISFVEVQ